MNLVRDRLFWQAWNKSAFLFVAHIKKYQVHKRFVQKVSQDVAWLGFPSSALPAIQKLATDKGFSFEQKSADHIIIGNVPQTSGYEEWWAGIVKKQVLLNAICSIRCFMRCRLNLTLHPKKIKLQPASKGFAFLGAYIYPHGVAIGKRVADNFKECIFNRFGSNSPQLAAFFINKNLAVC